MPRRRTRAQPRRRIEREHRALRQQLQRDSAPRRTQRAANRQLARASGGARQLQVRRVGARDEQHECNHTNQRDDRSLELRSDDHFRDGHRVHAPAGRVGGIGLRDALRDDVEVDECARRCEARSQPTEHTQISVAMCGGAPASDNGAHTSALVPGMKISAA